MNYLDFLKVNPSTLKEIEELGFVYEKPDIFTPAPPLPPNVNVKNLMSPVRYQGAAGTCTSFACVAGFEFIIRNGAGGTPPIQDIDLSEGHVTHATENLMPHPDCQPGLDISHVMYYLNYNGSVAENNWPYDEKVICSPNPPNLSNVNRFLLTQFPKLLFHRLNDEVIYNMNRVAAGEQIQASPRDNVTVVKQCLLTYQAPVIVDVPVFWKTPGGLDAGWENGTIHMPTSAQLTSWINETSSYPQDIPGSSGWHAIAIVGYDDATHRFEFKNSWGGWWGNRGYGTIPYEYIASYTREIWDLRGGYTTQIGPPAGGI